MKIVIVWLNSTPKLSAGKCKNSVRIWETMLLPTPPKQMKTTIIGLGLIGGSLAKDLRKTNFSNEFVGIDNNKINAKKQA